MCICVLIFIDDEMKEVSFLEVDEDWEKDVTEVESFFFMRETYWNIYEDSRLVLVLFDENFCFLWCFKMN